MWQIVPQRINCMGSIVRAPERWMAPTKAHAAAGVTAATLRGLSGSSGGATTSPLGDKLDASTSGLQQLYEVVARKLASGQLSAHSDVEEVCAAMDAVPLEELGLEPALAQALTYSRTQRPTLSRNLKARIQHRSRRHPITYLDILSCDEHAISHTSMTIGIFRLPEGATIPLHNHPGMTVFSRLLYGTLHIRSYDFVEPEEAAALGLAVPSSDSGLPAQPARMVCDRVLTAPAPTAVLFPASGGNVHAFTAVSPCAILDVLTPPYAPAEGRDCTYYREIFPRQMLGDDGQPLIAQALAWQRQPQPQQGEGSAGASAASKLPIIVGLQECQPPEDFAVARGVYRGRQLRCA